MPSRSTFTEERREKILQALRVGASRFTAAAMAGMPESTFRLWMKKGQDAAPGTRFAEFYADVEEAEASPRLRALGILYKEMPDNPALAWKFLERKEPGFEPPRSAPAKDEKAEPEAPRSIIDELAKRRQQGS